MIRHLWCLISNVNNIKGKYNYIFNPIVDKQLDKRVCIIYIGDTTKELIIIKIFINAGLFSGLIDSHILPFLLSGVAD